MVPSYVADWDEREELTVIGETRDAVDRGNGENVNETATFGSVTSAPWNCSSTDEIVDVQPWRKVAIWSTFSFQHPPHEHRSLSKRCRHRERYAHSNGRSVRVGWRDAKNVHLLRCYLEISHESRPPHPFPFSHRLLLSWAMFSICTRA